MTQLSDQFDQILEQVHNPSPQVQQLKKQWANKKPEETTQASRKVLYGIVEPSLNEAGVSQSVIDEVEALFESCFSKIEQGTSARSRQGAGSMG